MQRPIGLDAQDELNPAIEVQPELDLLARRKDHPHGQPENDGDDEHSDSNNP